MSGENIPAYWKRRIERLKERRTLAIKQQRNTQEENWKASEDKEKGEIVSSLKSIDRGAQSRAEQDYSKHFDPKWWQDRRFLLDISGVVVAAAALVALFGQQNVMQGQLDAMQAE